MRKSHLGLQQLGVGRVRRGSRRFVLEILERRELLAGITYTVNANTDTGTGTGTSGDLRYCITQVDSDPITNHDEIDFAIGGTAAIALASALPAITTPVFINGASEGAFTGVPLITLDATKVASTGSA